MLQPLWRGICQDLVKLKMHVPFNSAILLLDVFPEKSLAQVRKETCTRGLTEALFVIVKN